MAEQKTELYLSRSELVYTLNAMQAKRIVGMELPEFSLAEAEFTQLLRAAERNLVARGLMSFDTKTKTRMLDPVLVGMVGTLAKCSHALILVRAIRGLGQQLFIFNWYEQSIVEHTLPEEGQHRLALVRPDNLVARIEALVPIKPVKLEIRPRFILAHAEFEKIYDFISQQKPDDAKAVLASLGLPDEMTESFIQTLSTPEFNVSLAFLGIDGESVISASSATIFANEQSSWGAWSGVDGFEEGQDLVVLTGVNDITDSLADWLYEEA